MYCSSYIAEKPLIPTLTLKLGRCIKKLAKFRQSDQDFLKALGGNNIITKFHEYIRKCMQITPWARSICRVYKTTFTYNKNKI